MDVLAVTEASRANASLYLIDPTGLTSRLQIHRECGIVAQTGGATSRQKVVEGFVRCDRRATREGRCGGRRHRARSRHSPEFMAPHLGDECQSYAEVGRRQRT